MDSFLAGIDTKESSEYNLDKMFNEPQRGYRAQRVNKKGKDESSSSMGVGRMMKEDEKGYKVQRLNKKEKMKLTPDAPEFVPEKERKQAKVKKTRGKKGKRPYNKVVAEQSPIVRKENPGMKQPQVMKEIAKRWKSQK